MKLKTEIRSGLWLSRIATAIRCAGSVWILPVFLMAAFPETGSGQDFAFTNEAGKITITGRTGTAAKVTIPASIGGLPVTAIGDGAFSLDVAMSSVSIPDSVTTIGGAFRFCRG